MSHSHARVWQEPRIEELKLQKRASHHMQSRFSAPSLISRNSAHQNNAPGLPAPVLALPGFLAHPISHVRQASGRFPEIFKDIRRSVLQPKSSNPPAWAEKYTHNASSSGGGSARMEELDDGMLPPSAMAFPRPTPRQALNQNRISPPIPQPSWSHAPQLAMPQTHEPLSLGWQADTETSPKSLALYLTGGAGDASSTASSRPRENAPDPRALQSYHSVYSTPDTIISNPNRDTIGQALSPPGDDPVEMSHFAFPVPPTNVPKSILQRQSQAPSLASETSLYAPNLPPFSGLQRAEHGDQASSIFEYSSYTEAGGRGSSMTSTTRATRNWYEKPLWDNQGHGQGQGQRVDIHDPASGHDSHRGSTHSAASRASRSKSVRWEDEPLPKVFELARAL